MVECRGELFVSVREWFDRVNGNTYHTVSVVGSDGWRGRSSVMQYGHGEITFEYSARQLAGDQIGELVVHIVDVVRVSRKRDLFGRGGA